MPELPEVETVVRGLSPLLVGRRFTHVVARRPDLRLPLPQGLGQRLTGARVEAIRRRAKYGLIDTNRADTLIFHLGMSGKFRQLAAGEEPGRHDHILFKAGDVRLAFHDPRRFGLLQLVPTAEVAGHRLLAAIGPEPLSDDFNTDMLAATARGKNQAIKQLLLDQHVVAGIGNIYASEALFMAGVSPTRAAGRISRQRIGAIVDAVKAVLLKAIAAGGSTLRDHAQLSGDLGYFQHSFAVYGREGEPCHQCSTPIRRIVQSGRSTFFCRRCQR